MLLAGAEERFISNNSAMVALGQYKSANGSQIGRRYFKQGFVKVDAALDELSLIALNLEKLILVII